MQIHYTHLLYIFTLPTYSTDPPLLHALQVNQAYLLYKSNPAPPLC